MRKFYLQEAQNLVALQMTSNSKLGIYVEPATDELSGNVDSIEFYVA